MNALFAFRSPVFAVRRRAAVVAGVALVAMSIGGSVTAQFGPIIDLPQNLPTVTMPVPPVVYPPTVAATAAGPYLAGPAWNQTFAPNVRFVILSNFHSDAVLDRETGLVWARQTGIGDLVEADDMCRQLVVGNRGGWRLPAVAELQTLLDYSVAEGFAQPRLPAGHPFVLLPSNHALGASYGLFRYWTSEIVDSEAVNVIAYRWSVALDTGPAIVSGPNPNGFPAHLGVLCVRGPQGSSYSSFN